MASVAPPLQVLRAPRVTILARPSFSYPSHLPWRSDTPHEAQALVEFAGRLCYLSFGEDAPIEGGHRPVRGRTTNAEYVANLLRVGHGSVLEHAVWSVLVEGVSRALTHELVRHRHFSFSQLSQRYVDESDVAFVVPPELPAEGPAFEAWAEACHRSLEAYRALLAALEAALASEPSATLRRKRARQAARAVLPNCVETKIVVTGNARAWRHFLEVRGALGADAEIRRLALALLPVLQAEAPAIFGDLTVVEEAGVRVIRSDHPKV